MLKRIVFKNKLWAKLSMTESKVLPALWYFYNIRTNTTSIVNILEISSISGISEPSALYALQSLEDKEIISRFFQEKDFIQNSYIIPMMEQVKSSIPMASNKPKKDMPQKSARVLGKPVYPKSDFAFSSSQIPKKSYPVPVRQEPKKSR